MSTEALVPARQGELQAVSDGLDRLFRASIAPATYRLYERALTALDEALGSQPVTDQALAEYLAGLHAAGRAPATIAIVPAAVRFRAKLEDQPSPAGPLTARAMAGIRREGRDRGRGQAQGVGFSKADAAAVLAAAQGGLGGLRDAALILTASDGLLRVSEVAALEVGDVTAEEDGSGRLQVRRSKTDQEGRGAVLFLGEETLRRVQAWTAAAGLADGPLFRRVFGNRRVGDRPLSTVAIRKIIQRWAAAVGVEGRVSGHSLRIGGAQSLAAGGATLVELQTEGRWQSPEMPGHYTRGQAAAQGAVARIRYGRR